MPAADGAGEVLQALASGRPFGVAAEAVQQIDTHAAAVFLVGARAYKVKRAVRYSFLDFSSPERRRTALEAELALNREVAPTIYRRLVPLTREADGSLALDGAGEPVEWALEMARFDQEALLDRIALRHGLEPALIERLAQVVARFHAEARPRPEEGGHRAMLAILDGNARDFAAAPEGVLAPDEVAALNHASRSRLERDRDLLEGRRRAGRVRLCHGDLHLGNIVLLDGAPVLFDRIEFDEHLACTDVLYDLAFLLMDLIRRGLLAEACRLLDSYLLRSDEDEGTALLPLFTSVRAAIRAKVEALAMPQQRDPAHATAHGEAARAYLRLARDLLAPAPARLIAIGGLSGTGKSTLARRLAPGLGPLPGAALLRSDVTRKALFGREPTERLPQEAYREEVSAQVFAHLADRARVLLAAGRTVIADAVFADPTHRARIEAAARAAGVPFTGLWLEASPSVLEARVAARRDDASDAGVAVVRSQLRLDTGGVPWRRVASGGPLDALVAGVRAMLGGPADRPQK